MRVFDLYLKFLFRNMIHTIRHKCQWTSLNHMMKKDVVFMPRLYVDTNLNKVIVCT